MACIGGYLQCVNSCGQNTVSTIADVETRLTGANSFPAFATMIEYVYNMRANSSDAEGEVVCLLFLRVLSDGYSVFCMILDKEREELTIDWLRTELIARHDLLKGGKQSEMSTMAFLAFGTQRGTNRRGGGKCGDVNGGSGMMEGCGGRYQWSEQ